MDSRIKIIDGTYVVTIGDETFTVAPFREYKDYRVTGEPRLSEGSHRWMIVQDAIDGEGIIHRGFFFTWLLPDELKSHDICSYCGHDNGDHGQYREGFNCCYCGGN